MFVKLNAFFLLYCAFAVFAFPAGVNAKSSQAPDMLTPQYYIDKTGEFHSKVDMFLQAVQNINIQHPLADPEGNISDYTVPQIGEFGAGKGPTQTEQHHAAVDMHINNQTKVALYAAHDGIVHTYRDAAKYRHYLSITREIRNDAGDLLGKMVTIYGHIDLDLDEAENLEMHEKSVTKGQLVSKNLYSGTVGGPHLHFEIRYYRSDDAGTEEFYSFMHTDPFTKAAAGPWNYGYWMADVGYGFANPEMLIFNQQTSVISSAQTTEFQLLRNYPNPFNAQTLVQFSIHEQARTTLSVYNCFGQHVATLVDDDLSAGMYSIPFDAGELASGIYYYHLTSGRFRQSQRCVLVR